MYLFRVCSAFAMIGLVAPAPADAQASILVDKSERTVTIVSADGTSRRLSGARFGSGWKDGPKRRRGDERTPEGDYRIVEKRTEGNYRYLPALLIDYPNASDRARAKAAGVDPGDFILFHGPPRAMPFGWHPPGDWTDGCIALSPAQMKTLMQAAKVGMPVRIVP